MAKKAKKEPKEKAPKKVARASSKKDFEVNTSYKTNNEVQAEMDELRSKVESSGDEGLTHYAEREILPWLDQFDKKHAVVHNANFCHRAVCAYNHFINQQKNA